MFAEKASSFRTIAVALMLGGISSFSAHAAEIRYQVEEGDTLISIGQQLLARPSNWVVLQELNQIQNDRQIPTGFSMRVPVRLLKPEPREAEIIAVRGAVTTEGQTLAVGDRISAGTSIETDDDAHVILQLPDGSELALPARSNAHISTLQGYAGTDDQDVSIRLERGRVESTVRPQRGPAARYRIDTPTAVIGVRGTDFRVASDPDNNESRAEVTEGSVSVQPNRRAQAQTLNEGFGLVARAGAMPSRPVPLLAPPPLDTLPAVFERPLIRFTPPQVDGSVASRVQVRPLDGGAPLFDEVIEHEARIPDLADGQYLLQLRAIDGNRIEGQDAHHTFTLKARPEPPFQTMPRHQGKASAGKVDFEWARVSEAAVYHLQLAQDERFETLLLDEPGVDGVRFQFELEPGPHYWRIASIRPDGDRGPWSDPAQFEVRPPPSEPEPPEIGKDELVFRWSAEPGQRFEIQLARDEAFTDLLFSESTSEPEVVLTKPGPDTYWVRVRAIDPDGFIGSWTSAQQIIVPASFPWWMLLIPLLAL